MFFIKRIKVRSFEAGLHFHDGEFQGLLAPGEHWLFDPLGRLKVDVVSRRSPFLIHEKLDVLARSGALKGAAQVVDLNDFQRGLVWVDGRFATILGPGLHAYWLEPRRVEVEIVDARSPRFEHAEMKAVLRSPTAHGQLETGSVARGCVGVLFLDGRFAGALEAGPWAFWRGAADVRVVEVDLRDASLDVAGQEIMSADKVSLRINAQVTYRVVDPRKAVCSVDDFKQALYREAQLALRAVVGGRDLDALLADKQAVAVEAAELLAPIAATMGVETSSVGVRDLILPGDMKELMNKVIEARKAAEADLVTRREETAALRSQANTAKLLADNPTLMRLRELEVLSKIAAGGRLNVVLGDKKLSDAVLNIL